VVPSVPVSERVHRVDGETTPMGIFVCFVRIYDGAAHCVMWSVLTKVDVQLGGRSAAHVDAGCWGRPGPAVECCEPFNYSFIQSSRQCQ
jgi:hypothetical protein